jgi:hypothetical protein
VKYDSSGAAQWARTVGKGSADSNFGSLAVDTGGNVYAAGSIIDMGTFTFGQGVTAAGVYSDSNAVVVKYDSSGTAQWARTVSAGSNYSSFSSLAVDAGGNVYAAGSIIGMGTFTFGQGVTAAGTYGGSNAVVVKYDSSGAAQWARVAIADFY